MGAATPRAGSRANLSRNHAPDEDVPNALAANSPERIDAQLPAEHACTTARYINQDPEHVIRHCASLHTDQRCSAA